MGLNGNWERLCHDLQNQKQDIAILNNYSGNNCVLGCLAMRNVAER